MNSETTQVRLMKSGKQPDLIEINRMNVTERSINLNNKCKTYWMK